MRLQSNAHKNVCDERLSIVRQHGRFPKLAVVAILDDDLMSKSFAVEPAWRQALKSAGYYRTASGITATFLLSKQQRLRKYGLGAVCEATQLFNQIPGQEQMCDKMSVIKLLRAASHRLHLNLDEFMLPTILLAPPNRGGPSSSSNGAATDDDDDAFARFEQQLTSSSSNNGDEGVAWVHKRLGVENSQGVTPYSWRGLREKRQALGPAGFKRALSPGLLQKYLREPLLVDGRKTDLRCYVLVASVRPFAAFFYSEFVARVSPVVYAPTATDARAFTVGHFAKNKGASQGGKPQKLVNNTPDSTQMSPERLASALHSNGQLPQRMSALNWLEKSLRPELKRLTSRLLSAAEPSLSRRHGHFSLYGLDVLVDARLRLWFNEMNFSPGLADAQSGRWKLSMQKEMLSGVVALEEEVLRSRAFGDAEGPLVKRLSRIARSNHTKWMPIAVSEVANEDRIRWYHESEGGRTIGFPG